MRITSEYYICIMTKMKHVVYFLVASLVLFSACRKEKLSDNPSHQLSFSVDTLTFDTVFTQMGSATLRFMVYNRNNENINISSIQLRGDQGTNFRINVDGLSGRSFSNIEIKANDSMFVFAEVTIDPNDQTAPFFVTEHVDFITNGNDQSVVLSAHGQNAYYYYPNLFIEGLPPISHVSDYFNVTPGQPVTIDLPDDKPHVIYGFLMIDSAMTLNIKPGTQLHFYDQSGLWAYRGSTLKVNGQQDNEVVFQGHRLEPYYDDRPGQWDRIILNEGPEDHSFNYAIIKNGFIGIQAEGFYLDGQFVLPDNNVKLLNTKIQNNEGLGILARNHNVVADNVIINNSGNHLVALQGAGTHNFRHVTAVNYWTFSNRSEEAVYMSNVFAIGAAQVQGDLTVRWENSIMHGGNFEELATDSLDGSVFDWTFTNCVVRTERDTLNEPTRFKNITLNPPFDMFTDYRENDFTLVDGSAAIDKGDINITDTLLIDIKGTPRDNKPDLGAHEK